MYSVTLDLGNASWVKLNKNQKFYYRVNYALEDWQTLQELLTQNPQVDMILFIILVMQ